MVSAINPLAKIVQSNSSNPVIVLRSDQVLFAHSQTTTLFTHLSAALIVAQLTEIQKTQTELCSTLNCAKQDDTNADPHLSYLVQPNLHGKRQRLPSLKYLFIFGTNRKRNGVVDSLLLLERDFAGGFELDINSQGMSIYTGEIRALAGAVVPSGWLVCDGRNVDRLVYASLFSTITN